MVRRGEAPTPAMSASATRAWGRRPKPFTVCDMRASAGIDPKQPFGLRSLVLSWPPIGAAMTETRNLGEIVAIDVVGYSPDDVNE